MTHGRMPCVGNARLAALMLCFCFFTAKADILTVSAAGQFGAGILPDALAAPGALWRLSFQVDSLPVMQNPDPLSFDAPFSDVTYALNGSAVAATPESIRFFDSSDGGLFTIFFGPETGFMNGMPIPEFSFSGDQVFSGPTTSPTILPGSYPVADLICSDALNFDDEGAIGDVTIAGTAAVPEPSSFWLLLAASVALAAMVARRSWLRN